ncbi:hypothetical protein BWI93_22885 [Siphonobacter sp. BAB-5385]|uniref:hypothetical protein n=1 Tax=Siphonobacter sp. BAB-5385 TaxID=1864822 RepID=UPI000B9E8855|nr:hypothetical protein [Siphonobacter sp. BAB-5385]OZI05760.1 hypothetical protein BWI93_22885 [Siphonobacter sp. BAB-5385]
MDQPTHLSEPAAWSTAEKAIFRFFFLYFFIQVVPLDYKYYQYLFSIDWLQLSYREIFYLSRYSPKFIDGADTFLNWAIVAGIALVGSVVWSAFDRQKREYNLLYYWLRVLVRYRLAVGVLAYGFIKFFPEQSPLPSLSHLNTNYGDFSAWKLFSLSLGVVPTYESFLGLIEIIGGLLLLHRKTATIATLIILPFTGNVFVSNLAYEGGEYVYSLYLISLALFLFSFDAIRLFTLLSLEKATKPNRFQPVFSEQWLKNARLMGKLAFIVFFVFFYGYQTYAGHRKGSYQYPRQKGLSQAAGLYNVSEFIINGTDIPYSKTDPIRWKDVVFETWATLSIRSNRPVQIDSLHTEEIFAADSLRNYEATGSISRHYYSYTIDSLTHTLVLKNKNRHYKGEQLVLHYERPEAGTILLKGLNENRDSIRVVLNQVDKKYLIQEAKKVGRRKGLKL